MKALLIAFGVCLLMAGESLVTVNVMTDCGFSGEGALWQMLFSPNVIVGYAIFTVIAFGALHLPPKGRLFVAATALSLMLCLWIKNGIDIRHMMRDSKQAAQHTFYSSSCTVSNLIPSPDFYIKRR